MTPEAHVPKLEDKVSPVHEDGNFSDQILWGPDFDFPRSLCQLDGPPAVKKKIKKNTTITAQFGSHSSNKTLD